MLSGGETIAPPSIQTTIPPDPEEASMELSPDEAGSSSAISTALSVIATERSALEHLEKVYRTDKQAQESLDQAVTQIIKCICTGGKCVAAGVGKSGKVGQKIVATMNSLGVQSAFLHPTEAIHGDLGILGSNDTLLLISNSARTAELLLLVPHIPSTTPIIVLTSQSDLTYLPLLESRRPDLSEIRDILLPTPVHKNEQTSFGVAAPMTSTTVALAVGDALALATAKKLQMEEGRDSAADLFDRFHPGGVVGNGSSSSFPSSWAPTPVTPDSWPS